MKSLSSCSIYSFQEITQNHPLWAHDFLTRCRNGKISFQEVQLLAVQMYKFCQEFKRILAGIFCCCSDDSAQLVIMDNLFDEMGRGDPNQAHPELFRRFTRALGIDDETLKTLPTTPETHALIETYLEIPHKYGYLAGLGAVCYASEGIVSSLYTQLYQGITGANPVPKESLVFFDVHIDLDDNHAAKLRALIEPRITTDEEVLKVKLAILEAMHARVQFFNGIQRQISSSSQTRNSLLLV
jgi:pyrroloquinoline-quinone synthase